MRIFKTKPFMRFANQAAINDEDLCEAVRSAENGLIDANLGGGVIKQRIARKGQGKSSGFRSIVLFLQGERSFFVYGFSKSSRDNIRKDELKAFRALASEMLGMSDSDLKSALGNQTIKEIFCDG